MSPVRLPARKPEVGYTGLAISTLGNLMDNESVRTAVSLRLGIAMGAGHKCRVARPINSDITPYIAIAVLDATHATQR